MASVDVPVALSSPQARLARVRDASAEQTPEGAALRPERADPGSTR